MRIIDINGNEIPESQVDLEKGYLASTYIIKENVEPIDDITKFAYADDDYEEIAMYLLYREQTSTMEERMTEAEADIAATQQSLEMILLGVTEDE